MREVDRGVMVKLWLLFFTLMPARYCRHSYSSCLVALPCHVLVSRVTFVVPLVTVQLPYILVEH